MSQVSSAILDHDLMLQNDVLMFGNPVNERIRAVKLLNKEGFHLNAFSIGPALFYSIPLLPVYHFDDQRFGLAFQGGIALWVALFWFFGFAALYQILKLTGVSMNARYLALIASVFSTPFLLYGTRFYFTAHYLSAILVIFCLYFWIRWFQTSDYVWAWAMGLASGFLVITRWESGIFFVSFIWPLFLAFKNDSDRRKRFYGLLIGVLAGVLVLLVQLTAWKIQFGHWLLMPQGSGFMEWDSPAWIPFMFSGYHGLIPWSPGLLIGCVGLFIALRKSSNEIVRQLIPGILVFYLLQYYVSASAWDWWGGASYGPRRMTLLLAPTAIGWAILLDRCRSWLKFVPVILAIVWGGFTMSAFRWDVDDLTLLLTGEADCWRPERDPVTPEKIEKRWEHWQYGFKRWIVPGFALKNRPGSPHRRWGCIILMGVFALGEYFRRLLVKHRKLRWLTLGITSLYLLFVVIVFQVGFTPNAVWKDHWKGVVKNRMIPPPEPEYPRGYESAVKVIKTVHYLEQIQNEKTFNPEYLYDNTLPGISLEALLDYSKR